MIVSWSNWLTTEAQTFSHFICPKTGCLSLLRSLQEEEQPEAPLSIPRNTRRRSGRSGRSGPSPHVLGSKPNVGTHLKEFDSVRSHHLESLILLEDGLIIQITAVFSIAPMCTWPGPQVCHWPRLQMIGAGEASCEFRWGGGSLRNSRCSWEGLIAQALHLNLLPLMWQTEPPSRETAPTAHGIETCSQSFLT